MKKLFHSGGLLVASNLFATAVLFGQSIIVARALGPAGYGVWAVIQSLPLIVRTFLSFRTAEATTLHLVEFKTSGQRHLIRTLLSTSFYVEFLTRLVAFVIVVLLIPIASDKIAGGATAQTAYLIFAFSVLGLTLEPIWQSVLRDQKKYVGMALLQAGIPIVQVLSIVGFLIFDRVDILHMAFVMAAMAFLRLTIMGMQLRALLYDSYEVRLRDLLDFRVHGEWKALEKYWQFMRYGYVSSCVSSIVKFSDILILGYFRSDEEVGYYRLAKNLVNTIAQSASSLGFVIFQDLSELIAARNFQRLVVHLKPLVFYWLPTVAVFATIGTLISPYVIELVYGPNFAPAALIFNVLLAGVGTMTALFWVHPLTLALRLLRWQLALIVAGAVFFGLSAVLLTPQLGAVGTAIGLSGAWVIGYFGVLFPISARLLKARQS
mgnify:CR=1 FL=1